MNIKTNNVCKIAKIDFLKRTYAFRIYFPYFFKFLQESYAHAHLTSDISGCSSIHVTYLVVYNYEVCTLPSQSPL
jgi:hypothetical protein